MFHLGTTVTVVPTIHGPVDIGVGLKGLVEKDAELARIDREMKKVEKDLAALDKKLASPGFVDRAPPEVVAEARAQREGLIEAKKRLVEARRLAEEL
jgi:valyl-tRNA synthetase